MKMIRKKYVAFTFLSWYNAAALLADKNSFYGIDIARFGNSISEIMDQVTIEKEPVLKQFDKAMETILSVRRDNRNWA